MAGIVNMPSYRMYWADTTRLEPIADVMSRNWFDTMRNYLHINDNSTMKACDDPEYDKLFKGSPFVDSIKSSFQETEVEEYNSVDELIIPFKGRSSLKQYVRNKPHKQGIKVFAHTGSSGTVYDFEVYMGKGTVKNVSPLGISGDIVLRLVDGLPKGQDYKVFMDNWLTSFSLMCALKEIGILGLGTVGMSRLPGCSLKTDEGLKKLERGADDYGNEAGTNVTALKWYDNKPVYLIIFWSEIAHALLRAGKTNARKRGRSTSDSPTLELVNKKRVRNSAKVVDDVRCDCVGH